MVTPQISIAEKVHKAIAITALASVIGYLVFVPLLPVEGRVEHNIARIAQISVLLLTSVGLAFRQAAFERPPVSVQLFGCGVLLLAIGSCLNADLPWVALRELALLAGLVLVAKLVADIVSNFNTLPLKSAVVLAWALYGGVFLAMVIAALVQGQPLRGWTLVFGFDNPRFLNHAQTLSLPLLAGIAGSRLGPRLLARWAGFALVSGFLLLAFTMGRGTIVALLFVVCLAPLVSGRDGLLFSARLIVAAGLGAAAHRVLLSLAIPLDGLAVGAPRADGAMDAASAHARFFLWRKAIQFISDSPWLGIGPMHYAHHPNGEAAHPHNIYLQLASEFGIPFLILVVGAVLYALVRFAGQLHSGRTQGDAGLALGAFCACVAALVDGLFSGNFVMPVSQMWIAVAAGLVWAAWEPAHEPPVQPATGRRLMSRVAALVLLASQLWLLTVAWTEWRQPLPSINGHPGDPTSLHSNPRFWLQGWF